MADPKERARHHCEPFVFVGSALTVSVIIENESELRLTGWSGKPGTCGLFIFDSRPGNRNPTHLIEQSPNMLFELIQIEVHDRDLAAVEPLIEKAATLQKAGFSYQWACFFSQVMHVVGPPCWKISCRLLFALRPKG